MMRPDIGLYRALEEERRLLWRQHLLQDTWRRRRLGLQLLLQRLEELQQSPQGPLRGRSILTPSVRAAEVNYSRLTSFLEVDRSFLSPWNWNPNAPEPEDGDTMENEGRNQRMMFQPGSFYSYDQELNTRKQRGGWDPKSDSNNRF